MLIRSATNTLNDPDPDVHHTKHLSMAYCNLQRGPDDLMSVDWQSSAFPMNDCSMPGSMKPEDSFDLLESVPNYTGPRSSFDSNSSFGSHADFGGGDFNRIHVSYGHQTGDANYSFSSDSTFDNNNKIFQHNNALINKLAFHHTGHPFGTQQFESITQDRYATQQGFAWPNIFPQTISSYDFPYDRDRRKAVSAQAGTGGPASVAPTWILSDQNSQFDYPLHLHPSNMTTAAPNVDYSTTLPPTQDSSCALFRPLGNGSTQDSHGRMNSMGGAQYDQSSVTTPGATSPTDAPPNKMPLPPLKRNDSVSHAGPASKAYTVPARVKPGRKPMQESDPTDKRKTQNRNAQRKFRDKRAQKVVELEDEIQRNEVAHRSETQMMRSEIQQLNAALVQMQTVGRPQETQLRSENERLQLDISQLRAENARLVEELKAQKQKALGHQQHITSVSTSVHSLLTPPSDNDSHDDMEIDFTHTFSSHKQPTFTSIASPIGTDDHCGFCTEAENCVCRQQEELNKSLPPMDPSRATDNPVLPSDAAAPSFLEAPTKASGPGTCDMCLADPEKARQCRELAQTAQFAPGPAMATVPLPGRKASISSAAAAARANNERTTCSDFFQLAKQRNVQLGPENYSRIAHVYPYRRGDGRLEHSPAMEMDAQDAAHALAALSRQDTRSGVERQSC